MSAEQDTAYEKYLRLRAEARKNEAEEKVSCPSCHGEKVDRTSGCRGEYVCRACGYFWQEGRWQAT